MRRKEEECEEKNIIIAKAQLVIVKLREEMEKREKQMGTEREQQVQIMKQEIEKSQVAYNRVMGDFKKLEYQMEQKDKELKENKNQNEQRLMQVQKKTEEIIQFFKNEAKKA